MRRSFVLGALLAFVALFVTACGSTPNAATNPSAATVNGTEIPRSDLFTLLDVLSTGGATAGADESTALLNELVQGALAEQFLADEGIEITDADRQEARNQIAANPPPGVDEADLDFLGNVFASRIALIGTFDSGEPAPVTDEEVAATIEQFQDQIPEELSEEQVEAEVRAQLEQERIASQQQVVQSEYARWLGLVTIEADVTVNPRFGRWALVAADQLGAVSEVEDPLEAQLGSVVPPAGPVVPSTKPPEELLPAGLEQ